MRCNQSKEERFEELYRKYMNPVYRTSLHYTQNESDAEDIAQKVFCKLLEFPPCVEEEQLLSYLVSTAKNLSLNWLRDTKREREAPDLEELGEDAPVVESAEEIYLRQEEETEVAEFSLSLMRGLYEKKPMWYDIINMIYCLGISSAEAARMLGISMTALYSQLYRAKKWISKHYEDEYKNL